MSVNWVSLITDKFWLITERLSSLPVSWLELCWSNNHKNLSSGFEVFLVHLLSSLFIYLISAESFTLMLVLIVFLVVSVWFKFYYTFTFSLVWWAQETQQADPHSCRVPEETCPGNRKPTGLDLSGTESVYTETSFWSINPLINYGGRMGSNSQSAHFFQWHHKL